MIGRALPTGRRFTTETFSRWQKLVGGGGARSGAESCGLRLPDENLVISAGTDDDGIGIPVRGAGGEGGSLAARAPAPWDAR